MDLFDEAGVDLPFDVPRGGGYTVESRPDIGGFKIVVPDGELIYAENFFSRKVSDRALGYFQENDTLDWRNVKWADVPASELSKIGFSNIKWKQDSIKLYGKIIPLPRLTSWYGDPGKTYTYSGISSHPNAWNAGLLYLKSCIEQCAGVEFNSVLLNWYRDGLDHLNWHADDEKELGRDPIIASANFGEARDFVIRRNDDSSVKIIVPLRHGTLLLMGGGLQHFWQHSVPKRTKVSGSRFNLTFRRIGG
jgi:hypothetical protein